jgi:hypothetical protein
VLALHPAAAEPEFFIRPPETWSAVAAAFASSAGARNVAGDTSVPKRRRDVLAASAAIVVHASCATLRCSSSCEM